jgi:hypothetical protein
MGPLLEPVQLSGPSSPVGFRVGVGLSVNARVGDVGFARELRWRRKTTIFLKKGIERV